MRIRYKCGHCGYEGYCYGVPMDKGVSAPWCPQCQKNDKLTPIQSDSMVIGIVLQGYPLTRIRKIAELELVSPAEFLSNYLQSSSEFMELIDEELEDLVMRGKS